MQTESISPALFISSHPLVWLDLSGWAGASQKAGTPHPVPLFPSLHLYPQPDKTETERGRFLAAPVRRSYPEAGKKKERGGGLVGGEHSI